MAGKKLSEELRQCMDGKNCGGCSFYEEPETKVTCSGLLQRAYEAARLHEEAEENREHGELAICETDRGRYAVRPVSWAGIWNEKGQIKEALNHLALLIDKKEAENFVELKMAGEQGRLLRLPCAVGDATYRVNKGSREAIVSMKVCEVGAVSLKAGGFVIQIMCRDERDGDEIRYIGTDIGETVFLTRQEAERALEEMEDGKNEEIDK